MRVYSCIGMAYFGYDTCIACERHWSPEDQRKGYEWWRLRDREVTRWCCYRCIRRLWRKAGVATEIGPCPENVEDILQRKEFQNEISYLLKKHIHEHATEMSGKVMDVDMDDL